MMRLHVLKYCFAAIISLGLILASCEDEDQGEPEEPQRPEIQEFLVDEEVNPKAGNHSPGERLTFSLKANAPEGFSSFTMEVEENGQTEVLKDSVISGNSYEGEETYTISGTQEGGSTLNFIFVFEDNNDNTNDAKKEYEATITDSSNASRLEIKNWKVEHNGDVMGDIEEGDHVYGDNITFNFIAVANEGLDNLEIIETTDNPYVVDELNLSSEGDSAEISYEYEIEDLNVSKLDFEIADQAGQTESKSYDITINDPGLKESQTAILMGAPRNDTHPNFLNAISFQGFPVSEGKNNSEEIDFIYFYGSANKATIASPSSQLAEEFPVFELNDWQVRNKTTFKTNLNLEYEEVSTNNQLEEFWAEGDFTSNSELVNTLENGDVVMYETARGKKGVFNVLRINSEAEGSIKFNIKVQQ